MRTPRERLEYHANAVGEALAKLGALGGGNDFSPGDIDKVEDYLVMKLESAISRLREGEAVFTLKG